MKYSLQDTSRKYSKAIQGKAKIQKLFLIKKRNFFQLYLFLKIRLV